MTIFVDNISILFKGELPNDYIEELDALLYNNELDAYVNVTSASPFPGNVTEIEGHMGETFESALTDVMDAVVRISKETGIDAEGRISYSGDYTGAYLLTENGRDYEDINSTDLAIIDADTNDLIKELEKRGYSVTKAA